MPKQARAAQTRQALIAAAAGEFDLSGYEGSSLARISKAAQISMGALTFHFPAKGELSRAVMTEAATATREALGKVLATPASGLDSVIAVTAELARLLERETVVRAAARLSRELPQSEFVWHAVWIPVLRRLLLRTEPGEMRPGTDPALVVALATHLVIGAEAHVRGRLYAPGTHPGQADERLMGLWRLALAGISGRAAALSSAVCPCPGQPPVAPLPPKAGTALPGAPRGRGATLWLTGPSERDSTAVARALAARLSGEGHPVEVLDSSALRDGLASEASSPQEKHESGIRRVGLVAASLARSGVKVVVALSVPRHDSRVALRARHALQGSHFLEVHVGSAPGAPGPEGDEAAAGTELPGRTPYEEHAAPDLYLPAYGLSTQESVGRLLDLLSVHGLV